MSEAQTRFYDAELAAVTGRLFDALNEVKRLRKGIQDYLDGNYSHSRSYRPDRCPHGILWFEGDCDQCGEEHFKKLLDPASNGDPT